VQQPKNLSVVVIDNERYGETGMQATHTARGVDLAAVAKACGFRNSQIISSGKKISQLVKIIQQTAGPNFAQVKVKVEQVPLVLPPKDGVLLKARFRRALLGDSADVLPQEV